jgi:hypothetical protein
MMYLKHYVMEQELYGQRRRHGLFRNRNLIFFSPTPHPPRARFCSGPLVKNKLIKNVGYTKRKGINFCHQQACVCGTTEVEWN